MKRTLFLLLLSGFIFSGCALLHTNQPNTRYAKLLVRDSNGTPVTAYDNDGKKLDVYSFVPEVGITVADATTAKGDESPQVIATSELIRRELKTVYFENNKYNLSAQSKVQLKEILTELQKHPTAKLFIEGYADNTGPLQHNQKLSKERANVVRKFLSSNGIPNSRIAARGFGPQTERKAVISTLD